MMRRSTTRVLMWSAVAADLAGLAASVAGLWIEPRRWPAAALIWLVACGGTQLFTGDRPSKRGCLFTGLFGTALAGGIFGLVCLRLVWHAPAWVVGLVGAAVLALHGLVLMRLLVASGSADYPYED